jgi:ELWxxDGT repeat protein
MRRQAALRATTLDANQPTGGLELRESEGAATGNALVKDINPGTAGSTRRFLTRRQRAGARSSRNSSWTGRIPTSPACVTAADRASVGEVRGGEVLSLLKAWNTGHPGGGCTVHANDARGGLRRIEQLIAEVSQNPDAGTDRRRGEPDRVHRTPDSNLGS